MEKLTVIPAEIREGVPVTVTYVPEERAPHPPVLEVTPETLILGPPFTLTLTPRATGEYGGQFTLFREGNYRLHVGKTDYQLQIAPQRNLTFFTEFGLFTLAVVALVGGMLIWLKRSKQKPDPNASAGLS